MSKTGKTIALVVGVLFVLAAIVALAAAAKADAPTAAKGGDVVKKEQTKCPVMGNPINRNLFVEKDGKRIYVCCNMCTGKVTKDFDTYAKKLEAEGIDLTIPKDAAKPAAAKTAPMGCCQ